MKSVCRFIITALCIYSVLILTACPAASMQKVQANSSTVAKYANAGVDVTRSIFESKVITLEQKDAIATKFVQLARAGEALDSVVANAIATYGSSVPSSEVQKAFSLFDSTVVTQFLDLLQSLKLISNTGPFAAVIETIRTAVILIADTFGHKATVTAQLAAAN